MLGTTTPAFDPIGMATDIVTDNAAVAVGLVVALFGLTLGPRLGLIAVKKAGQAVLGFARKTT